MHPRGWPLTSGVAGHRKKKSLPLRVHDFLVLNTFLSPFATFSLPRPPTFSLPDSLFFLLLFYPSHRTLPVQVHPPHPLSFSRLIYLSLVSFLYPAPAPPPPTPPPTPSLVPLFFCQPCRRPRLLTKPGGGRVGGWALAPRSRPSVRV